MSIIISTLVSFLVSGITCLVVLQIWKKRCFGEEKNQQAPSMKSERKEEIDFPEYHHSPRKEFTFDNFFTDDPTFIEKMKSILDNHTSSNPLILNGPSGIGKTHLIKAFENYLLEKDPSKKICYIPADVFLVEFIESLQKKKNMLFRIKFRNLDALFIDNFEHFNNKAGVQTELFNIISELLEKNVFICLAFTSSHSLDYGFSEKLVNVISGLGIDMPEPGFESKRKKIMRTFENANCYINGDLVDYLASLDVNMNELAGTCKRIILMKGLEGKGCVNLEIDEIKNLVNYS
jgi:chromosomal replication initiator protein